MNLKEEKIEILARCKKNAKLCFAYQGTNKRKKYSENKFSPEGMREDNTCPWKGIGIFYGGKKISPL
jgi:hypothetical protein